jgi:hypothetical protein
MSNTRATLMFLLCFGFLMLGACGKIKSESNVSSSSDSIKESIFIIEEFATPGSKIKLGNVELEGAYAEDAENKGRERFLKIESIDSISGSSEDELESLQAVAAQHGLYVRASDLSYVGNTVLGEEGIPLFRMEDIDGVDSSEYIAESESLYLGKSEGAFDEWESLSPSHFYSQWVRAGVPVRALDRAIAFFEANSPLITNKRYMVIADFSAKSSKRRLYFFNLLSGSVERFYVAHGAGKRKQVGPLWTSEFSNTPNSMLTPKGFHLTSVTYMPSPSKRRAWGGLALRLRGLQQGKNDNSMRRGVVFHGTAYATEAWVRQTGYTGRSLGCPATDRGQAQRLIQNIKGGALFYHYAGE